MKKHEENNHNQKQCTNCLRQFRRQDHFQNHIANCLPDDEFVPSFTNIVEREQDEQSVPGDDSVDVPLVEMEESMDEIFQLEEPNDEIFSVGEDEEIVQDGRTMNEELPFTLEEEENFDFHVEQMDVHDDFGILESTTVIDAQNMYVCDESFKQTKRRNWKELKEINRKRARLENIVGDIASPEKKKVVRSFIRRNHAKALEEVLAYTSSESSFEAMVTDLVIIKLNQLKRERKFANFYSLFDQFFGEQIDEAFMTWLVNKKLGSRVDRFLPRYKEWQDRGFVDSRGRRRMNPEVVTKIFNMFVDNSISSTDGWNGRNVVKMSKRKFLETYGQEIIEHKDIKIETMMKRNRAVYVSNRRIATCTIRAVQKKLKEEEGIDVSIGKLLALKPFFITHPTDKELALCLCKLCLNCRLLLDVLNTQGKKDGERVTDSVTEFFMDSSKCEKTERLL